jgi:hypothetical protein
VKVDIRKSLSENEIAQINKSGAGLVLWFAPEVMAETDEAKKIFVAIQQNLQKGQNLKEAVKNALASKSGVYIYHPMEVNKVCNGEKLTQSLGSNGIYKRFAYTFDSTRAIGNIIILPFAPNNFFALTTSDWKGNLLEPAEQFVRYAREENGGIQRGVLINGSYFITQNWIDRFNKFNVGYQVSGDFVGEYLGFLVKGGRIFVPLYNKGALIKWEDGSITMERVSLLPGGKIENIGDTQVDIVPDAVNEENPESSKIVVYTPMFEKVSQQALKSLKQAINSAIEELEKKYSQQEMTDALYRFKDALDRSNPSSYNALYGLLDPYGSTVNNYSDRVVRKDLITKIKEMGIFQVKVPQRENVVNIVIIGDIVVHVGENEETVIPPFGYVISIPQDKLGRINISKNMKIVYKPKIQVGDKIVDLSESDEIKMALGGVTLLYDSRSDSSFDLSIKQWLQQQNDVMKKEGWNLISSRRTQDTDFALIDNRDPRQVLGLVEKDGKKYFMVFTVSGRTQYSKGAGFGELLYMIVKEVEESGYSLISLLNLDGGSSVNTHWFEFKDEELKLYNINIPAPGPNSKTNQPRDISSALVINF